jgi:hypothetical protein
MENMLSKNTRETKDIKEFNSKTFTILHDNVAFVIASDN